MASLRANEWLSLVASLLLTQSFTCCYVTSKTKSRHKVDHLVQLTNQVEHPSSYHLQGNKNEQQPMTSIFVGQSKPTTSFARSVLHGTTLSRRRCCHRHFSTYRPLSNPVDGNQRVLLAGKKGSCLDKKR